MPCRSDYTLRTREQMSAFWAEVNATAQKREYFDKVCRMLETMKPNTLVIIDNICREENMQTFIGSVCMYADAYRNEGIEFSNDYKMIKKQNYENKNQSNRSI